MVTMKVRTTLVLKLLHLLALRQHKVMELHKPRIYMMQVIKVPLLLLVLMFHTEQVKVLI